MKTLVLIGGGHSHAIALRQWIQQPLENTRLVLVSDVRFTPYSGMLPGHIAGQYSFHECHIDLLPLAKAAGAAWISDRAVALDLNRGEVHCSQHPPIPFDRLSINIGSTPTLAEVPGAAAHAVPIKPIALFLDQWNALLQGVQQSPYPLRVAIVGGGAGGVELALAVQSRLSAFYRTAAQEVSQGLEVHLLHRGAEILEGRDRWIRCRMASVLQQRGIHLHLSTTVDQVTAGQIQAHTAHSSLTLDCDRIFWVTHATAPDWIAQSALATDARGFICVNAALQSISHDAVFAAGDIATQITAPRPKAGVFAVRQGRPLAENLRRSLHDLPLQPFYPQKEFLILLGTGDGAAVASRGRWGLGPYRWLWRWKDEIDRQFMKQFQDL